RSNFNTNKSNKNLLRSSSSFNLANKNRENINKFSQSQSTNFNSTNSNNFNGYRIPIKHKHLKSGKKCIACELKNRIQNKGEIEHSDHVKFKINYDTNKLLLETKSMMKKLNFKKAYEMLKLPISQGLYHADIFYLFGEVSRVLKKLEESELYLLECLK